MGLGFVQAAARGRHALEADLSLMSAEFGAIAKEPAARSASQDCTSMVLSVQAALTLPPPAGLIRRQCLTLVILATG